MQQRILSGLGVLLLLLVSSEGGWAGGAAAAPTPPPGAAHPTLVYSTYYGSTSTEERNSTSGDALALNAAGQAIITGMTSDQQLPLKNPYDRSHSGDLWDGYIAQFTANGWTRRGQPMSPG